MSKEATLKYRRVIKLKRKIATLQGDEYFKTEGELNQALRDVIGDVGFFDLYKGKILEVLALCSTHRPMQPHQILTIIGMRIDDWNADKLNNPSRLK